MKIRFAPLARPRTGTLVLVLAEGAAGAESGPPLLAALNAESDGAVARSIAAARFAAKAGQVCALLAPPGLGLTRLVLVGAGPAGKLDRLAAERAGGTLAAALDGQAEAAALIAEPPPGAALDAAVFAVALAAGASLRAWRFERYRTRPVPGKDAAAPRLARLDLLVPDRRAAAHAWAAAEAAVAGTLFARDLITEPANRLTPAQFADQLRALRRDGVEVEILPEPRLRKLGFGALLGVGQGSPNRPLLAVLRWRGQGRRARRAAERPGPLAFVGKGVCFDTGGISIKPADRMWEMRADMAGAAAAAGAMLALARRRAPVDAVAVLGLVENAISERALRPSDVVRSLSGKTVEVIDTDAEGRLVLADCLHYAATRFRPAAMVDLATLTGSIVVALGHERAGLFASDAALAAAIAAAGEAVGEPVWPMPLSDAYLEGVRSPIADLRNCHPGRMQPDACHAAIFLRQFAGAVPWAHLDIAGVDTRERADALGPKGAAGWGVRLLDRLSALRFEGEAARPTGRRGRHG
ncbi:MAG: leucyl aminopeptidase [Alphaproteobacteria bacterium]|nr:leucyl aminopeptidase [Alphaproteobacteria bacterium]